MYMYIYVRFFRYVAEQMRNRVLRFFQRPEGVYHGSVFHQLSGGVGPSCLALDEQGVLYIGQFEIKGNIILAMFNFSSFVNFLTFIIFYILFLFLWMFFIFCKLRFE